MKSKSRREYEQSYYEKNKKRIRANNKKWYDNNPERRVELQWQYRGVNLTYERYQSELEKQNGKCKICNNHMVKPQVDHKTGEYRGLLCIACNVVLGVYERNHKAFEQYLEQTCLRN